jgi:8-oxo-dGTP pyrophosphatase MutT (NUDIX family)
MARHAGEDRSYWVLPGGAVEEHETPAQAAVREVLEETGLAIVVERLLFVDGPRHTAGVRIGSPRYTYLGQIVGGTFEPVDDGGPGNPGNGRLVGAAWMPFDSPEFDAATRDTLALVAGALQPGLSVRRASVE